MTKLIIGIDIGGTFTDIIIQDKDTGEILKQIKVATTPKQPEHAIENSINNELTLTDKLNIQQIYHATTIASNAFLGQVNLELPQIALITTKGFRDILEIGRQKRVSLYNLFVEKPKPIIPRKYRFEVEERLDSQGNITIPLNDADLVKINDHIKKENIQGISISLLHSYKNPIHEKRIKDFFEKNYMELYISASFEVSPEHREYERTSTTTINAILMPLISKYLKSLTDSFVKNSINVPLFIMQSNGGVSKSDQVQKFPVSIIEGGPSAGVVASRFLADFLNYESILSFDMGGTTAKAGTIVNKIITLTSEYEIGGEVHFGRITKGSGYPARYPFIDLVEISSGGGSIAWVDEGLALKVGPISAGAEPGPACYNRGGENPTITDVNLFLGRLNPKGLLNQTFKIYPDLAEKSISKKLAKPLAMDPINCALGVIKIAINNMSRILRIVTVERGLDPRNFTLLAFGGAGPMHACALANELSMKEILIPTNPGLFSTMGLLNTNAEHAFLKSIRKNINDINFSELEHMYKEMENKGVKILVEEDFSTKNIIHQRIADLRYSGQGFELMLTISHLDLQNKKSKEQLAQQFIEKHKAIYGYILEKEDIEVVNIRTNSLGLIKKPILTKIKKGTTKPTDQAIVEHRSVYFEEYSDYKQTAIFNRELLLANNEIRGPAIIEQYDSTTTIPPKWKAKVNDYGLLRLLGL